MSEQAGREMDARVAEKVMGWKRVRWCDWQTDTRTSFTYSWHDAVTGKMTELAEDCDDYYNPKGSWSPSTDIEAAWEVVTALERKSLFLTLSRNQIPNDANGQQSKWDVLLWDNGKQVAHNATADTAPLAICKAALKAVGA